MIDGFKLRVNDNPTIQRIFHNTKLDFKSEVSHHTGEVSNIYKAQYKGLRFEYLNFPNRQTMFIRGSLPFYYTGLSNYTNMPLTKAWEALTALIEELGLDRYATEVIKLEWGVNCPLPEEIAVNRLISNILVYKGRRPSQYGYEGDGMMFLIDLNDFSIKIYNKSAQHKGHEHSNVLRYELKVNRKNLLNRLGIYALSDLFEEHCIHALQDKLSATIEHLLFYDYSIAPETIPARSKALLLEYNNSVAWTNLLHHKPELYRKKKKAFTDQVTKASGIDWNKLLQDKVKETSNSLLQVRIKPVLQQA